MSGKDDDWLFGEKKVQVDRDAKRLIKKITEGQMGTATATVITSGWLAYEPFDKKSADEPEILRLRKKGWTHHKIAYELRIHVNTVGNVLRRNGVSGRAKKT